MQDINNLCESSEEISQPISDINERQIQNAFRTIRKIKNNKIKVIQLKKRPSINRLFYQMSKFFIKRPRKLMSNKEKMQKIKKQINEIVRIKKNRENVNQLKKYKNQRKLINLMKQQQRIQQKMNNHQQQSKDNRQYNYQIEQQGIEDINAVKFPKKGRICYVCKNRHFCCHPQNKTFCFDCGKINFAKRNQSADLSGKVALVTGARIKIGYEITLKLLLDGATVIASTRFPQDALLRYKSHVSYQTFKDRLFLVQCDFVSALQVKQLISYIKTNFNKLDILINNAAQTIARPKQFYKSQLAFQSNINKEQNTQAIVCQNVICDALALATNEVQNLYPSLFLRKSQSQDKIDHTKRDAFNQPLDTRSTNSWLQTIENVSLVDCLTTQIVNSVVPFHLIGALKSMMTKPSWIINVGAMEGVFYRPYRLHTHPHTNMAKAALNMITRTCSPQFAKENIFMNSVDTGWVSDMYPMNEHIQNKDREVPLDCLDGAMRVLDPIYLGVLQNSFPHGLFFKDYKESLF